MLRWGVVVAASVMLAACATVPVQSRSSSAYADYLIGRIANSRDDYAAASDRYFAALARAPDDDALLNGALTASLASGDAERARRAARMAPTEDAPAYAHLVRATEALAAQRWRSAGSEIGRVEGAASEELLGRILLVWIRAGEGRLDDVIVDLAPLTVVRSYGGLFAYQQAMALDFAGRGDEALAAYATATNGGLWLPAAIERHADLLVRRGARDEAIALLSTDANRANPALSAALARVEARGQAVAAPLTPARGAAIGLYGLSAIFLEEGDSTNGLASLTLALMLDPTFDGARLGFAQHQARLGHVETAQRTLAEVSPQSAYALSARILESWILLDSGASEAALARARENAASGETRALRTLADIYRNLGRYEEAEPIYSQLVAQNPDDWRLHFARGAARERIGRWPDAEADLRRALELAPDQPDVLNYLGYTWVDRGEHMEEGLAMIQRAVELRPNSGAIIDSLGWAYFRMGDYERALQFLEQAVELEPADATLNDHLGDVYWRLGRRIEARFQWERALTLDPDDADAIAQKLEAGLPAAPATRSARR